MISLEELMPGLDVAKNVHPLFVHFPLGVWPIALGFLFFGALRNSERLLEVGRWLLYLATAAAVVTAFTGWLAANGLGHETPGHELVHEHRNWMLVATGLSAAASALAFALRRAQRPAARWAVVGALAVTLGVASLGADRGAFLVYGKGVGTSITPASTSSGEGAHEEPGHHDDDDDDDDHEH